MDIEKLLNYLERKTADTHELQAASAIIGLRQRVAELERFHELDTKQIAYLFEERDALMKQRDELTDSAELLIKVMAGTQAETDFSFQMFMLEYAIASVKEKQ